MFSVLGFMAKTLQVPVGEVVTSGKLVISGFVNISSFFTSNLYKQFVIRHFIC